MTNLCKFYKSSYLNSHSSASIHIWTIDTWGLAFIPWLLAPGLMPREGARGQNLGHLKNRFSTLLLWKQLRQIVGQTSVSLVTLAYGSWSKSHHDLYFMVQWFCLVSWRLFDVWTSYFRIMCPCNPTFALKINVGHCDLYFMVQGFCLISWRLFDIWTSYFRIMSQYDLTFDLKNCRSLWPIFYGPVIFALYLEAYLIYEHHTLGLWVSMTQCST